MLSDQIKSTNFKLAVLIGILVVLFVSFAVYFLKDYVSYYADLYTYRERLIASLSDTNTAKPYFNATDPYKGNPRAKIVIFEYADFSCEACAAIQPDLKEVESFYGPNNVLFIFKDVPVTVSPNTKLAHQAAHCAQEQNAFYPYHDQLFEHQSSFSHDFFVELAENLKLNTDEFKTCLDSDKYSDLIDNNLSDALKLGVEATPTLFINNEEVISGFSFQNLRAIIEKTK